MIRTYSPSDLATLHRLNEAAVPHVNSLQPERLKGMIEEEAFSCDVVELEGNIVGFLLAMSEGGTYESLNYQWYLRAYERFTYIDRVILDPSVRRGGWGRKLYGELAARARAAQSPRLTCDVNLQPPNPISIAFHESLGFAEVAQQETEGGQKRVALMVRELERQ